MNLFIFKILSQHSRYHSFIVQILNIWILKIKFKKLLFEAWPHPCCGWILSFKPLGHQVNGISISNLLKFHNIGWYLVESYLALASIYVVPAEMAFRLYLNNFTHPLHSVLFIIMSFIKFGMKIKTVYNLLSTDFVFLVFSKDPIAIHQFFKLDH